MTIKIIILLSGARAIVPEENCSRLGLGLVLWLELRLVEFSSREIVLETFFPISLAFVRIWKISEEIIQRVFLKNIFKGNL